MALAAVLKKYPDTPNVVFISTDREMAMQGYRVDAKRYLPKPLDPELLREAPVSYTHLDVYKRQLRAIPCPRYASSTKRAHTFGARSFRS